MSAKLVVYPKWGTKKEKISRLDKKQALKQEGKETP